MDKASKKPSCQQRTKGSARHEADQRNARDACGSADRHLAIKRRINRNADEGADTEKSRTGDGAGQPAAKNAQRNEWLARGQEPAAERNPQQDGGGEKPDDLPGRPWVVNP